MKNKKCEKTYPSPRAVRRVQMALQHKMALQNAFAPFISGLLFWLVYLGLFCVSVFCWVLIVLGIRWLWDIT
jgi:hypothetical protein